MPSNINSVTKNKIKKKKFRPTDPNFFQHVTVNTHIFFFLALQVLLFFGQIRPGVDPGWGQSRSRGSPSSTNFCFRLEGYYLNNSHSLRFWLVLEKLTKYPCFAPSVYLFIGIVPIYRVIPIKREKLDLSVRFSASATEKAVVLVLFRCSLCIGYTP